MQKATKTGKSNRSYWRKVGGGSLTISLIVHAVFLILALLWVWESIPKEKREVPFLGQSGGGGNPNRETMSKKRASMSPVEAPRIAAAGVSTGLSLPEPTASSTITSIGSLSSGEISGGLGGSGSGGGRGDGSGKGFGSGMGPGLASGAPAASPFGSIDPRSQGLVGVFFDTKRNQKGEPTNITEPEVRSLVAEFTTKGWKERSLSSKYFQAPQKLKLNRIYMPRLTADVAPAAFNCKEVEPRFWIVIYRGTVVPPKSGKFRFVGAGDDAMVVRFNGKNLFDHGYTLGTMGISIANLVPILNGSAKSDSIEEIVKKSGAMKIPITYYRYSTTSQLNEAIGGFAVGPEIEVKAGQSYPIEILISEIPGGFFSASLLFQESGVEYPKTPEGSPILPIFRFDQTIPDGTNQDDAPPFDPNGPVWKVVESRGAI
jgi:hypothetical protein